MKGNRERNVINMIQEISVIDKKIKSKILLYRNDTIFFYFEEGKSLPQNEKVEVGSSSEAQH